MAAGGVRTVESWWVLVFYVEFVGYQGLEGSMRWYMNSQLTCQLLPLRSQRKEIHRRPRMD